MEGKALGSGKQLLNTSHRSLPKLKVSILVVCCSLLNTSGAEYITASGPGVLQDWQNQSLTTYLSTYYWVELAFAEEGYIFVSLDGSTSSQLL